MEIYYEWMHSENLDTEDNLYLLKWSTVESQSKITFLVKFKTLGWVAFNLSPDRKLKQSDLVIGWVSEDGKAHCKLKIRKMKDYLVAKFKHSLIKMTNFFSCWTGILVSIDYYYGTKITKGNKHIVHHMFVTNCVHPDSKQLDKYPNTEGFPCDDTDKIPMDLKFCLRPYLTWVERANIIIFLPEIGLGIVSDEESTYFMFQVHYSNKKNEKNIEDSSGFRVYITSEVRENEIGQIFVGTVFNYGLL